MTNLTSRAVAVCWKLRDAATGEERVALHNRGLRILKREWRRQPPDADEEYIGRCESLEAAHTTDRDFRDE